MATKNLCPPVSFAGVVYAKQLRQQWASRNKQQISLKHALGDGVNKGQSLENPETPLAVF